MLIARPLACKVTATRETARRAVVICQRCTRLMVLPPSRLSSIASSHTSSRRSSGGCQTDHFVLRSGGGPALFDVLELPAAAAVRHGHVRVGAQPAGEPHHAGAARVPVLGRGAAAADRCSAASYRTSMKMLRVLVRDTDMAVATSSLGCIGLPV